MVEIIGVVVKKAKAEVVEDVKNSKAEVVEGKDGIGDVF